jgi:phage terminase large subunit-like protein
VRDGIVTDESFLPVIYAADPEDDYTLEATWRKANPGLGATVKLDYLRQECARAMEIPAAQNTFRRLHLNQWTEQADRWLDLAVWDRNVGAVPDSALLGRPAYLGLDLASTRDLTALAIVVPLEDGRFALRTRFWVPDEQIKRRSERDRVPYDLWVAQGLVTATPGNVVDYAFVRAAILEVSRQYQVREIAYDPWNATQLVTQLADDGATMVEFRQGFASMSAPTKEFEKLLLAGRLAHGGNPVLRWMASNVAVKQDPAGNVKPDKAASTERIDGIVAAIMAVGRATMQSAGGWDFAGFDLEMH